MRIDVYLEQNMGVATRSKAVNLIKLGKVKVNGVVVTKPAMDVEGKNVELLSDMDYASMGGYKLDKALKDFNFNATGLVAIDIGASNGGFTDVLLHNGIKRVYAVDVGECALPDEMRSDSRVIVKSRLNARGMTIEDVGEKADLIVIDVSFISLKLIFDNLRSIINDDGSVIALIKPQFEVGKKNLSKKGIVIDAKVRKQAVDSVIEHACRSGFRFVAITEAPIRQYKNIEYLIYLQVGSNV